MKNLPSGVTLASGGGAQISNTRYVDAGAAGGGDGSIGAPFQTIQEGFTALAALASNRVNLLIFPGNYDEATPVWAASKQLLVGTAVGGYFVGGNSSVANQPFIENQIDISGAGDRVSFFGLELFEGVDAVACDFFGCKVWQLSDVTTNCIFKQCELIGIVGTFGSVAFDDCVFNGCTFLLPTGGTVVVTNADVAGTPGPAFDFTDAPDPGVVLVDSQTNYWFTQATVDITNGAITVMS